MAAPVNREKLGQDLRKVVRSMSPHPIFSSRWFAMLGSLQHITDVAVVEQKHHGEQAPDGKEGGTLWERNELIVRYMLEEGKLNLCLRLLIDFKTMQRNEEFADALTKAKASEPAAQFDDLPTIKIKAAMFEQGLGLLLACALNSVESLQTLDMPALIVHMGHCLKFSLSHSEMVRSPDADRRQEVLCHHYLAAMFDRMENLQEDRILELMQENDIFSLVVTNVEKFHEFFSVPTKINATKAMSGILGSEAFKTSPSDFVTSTELKKIVVGFEAAYIKELFPDYNAKKTIRPLLDAIAKFKYQV
mmetsp:Transcript_54888/g.128325  ORF Transcript_54888/g.128325 Transcript_54888/m.128325 type:complete len:304 (-) Transcript_54888:105-1016(-)